LQSFFFISTALYENLEEKTFFHKSLFTLKEKKMRLKDRGCDGYSAFGYFRKGDEGLLEIH
jgi:hypothetical protein